jgi:nicotinamidase/pyrazinamidase
MTNCSPSALLAVGKDSVNSWHYPAPWQFKWFRSDKGTWLPRIMEIKTAIIIVDVQNDFVEGGALAVKGGKAIIPKINAIVQGTLGQRSLVITTQDWHPLNHSQFETNGGNWPVHCLEGSAGANLVKELQDALPKGALHAFKGMDSGEDGYSAFEGYVFVDGPGDVALNEILKTYGTTHVYVCGIATDHCVRATVMDAVKHGYSVTLLTDCIAGVSHDSSEAALTEMAKASVQFMSVPTDTP